MSKNLIIKYIAIPLFALSIGCRNVKNVYEVTKESNVSVVNKKII